LKSLEYITAKFDLPFRFEKALFLQPDNKQALFNLASIMHMVALPTLAVGYILRLLLIDPEDNVAHSFLWALNRTGECNGCTLKAYEQLAARGDLRAITKLAALTGTGTHAARGDPAYAEQIYDDMADKFEGKLVNHLGYRGPWQLLERLDALYAAQTHTRSDTGSSSRGSHVSESVATLRLRKKGEWRILDVGCGSGLVGKVFADYVRNARSQNSKAEPEESRDGPGAAADMAKTDTANDTTTPPTAHTQAIPLLPFTEVSRTSGPLMVGIDVSQRMTEITAATGHYDCAHHSDLTAALRQLDCTDVGATSFAVDAAAADSAKATDDNIVATDDTATRETVGRSVRGVETTHTGGSNNTKIGMDMVVAADTFIYVGALGEVFQLVRNVLQSAEDATDGSHLSAAGGGAQERSAEPKAGGGGLFVFTTEDLEQSPMRVQPLGKPDHSSMQSGGDTTVAAGETQINEAEIPGAVPGWGAQLLTSARFAHSDRYVRALCEKHGFCVLCHERIVLRTEETVPLPGNIYILQKEEKIHT
jgi:predicted TPR repeat methyltransferase